MEKRIKIFLGAYVNFPNAQNINCDHIAKYLDNDKFEVHTMYTSMCPINKAEYKELGIHLHKLIHHRFIWYWCKYLTMLFGKYDIYYLPKVEKMDIAIAKRLNRQNCSTVASVENVIGGGVCDSPLYYEYYTKTIDYAFAISRCIQLSAKNEWNFDLPVLHLGVDPLNCEKQEHNQVKRIVWVGSFIKRKRPSLLLKCAKAFPSLEFIMIGNGDLQSEIKKVINIQNINNIQLTGRIPNGDVYQYMINSDLLLMTSDNEGLPKVIQEAAQCGLPSIYIGENYDVDFIESGVNGFKVMSLEEMKEKIQYLIDHPEEYAEMSKKAAESVQEYLWPVLIKKYEEYFERVYKEKVKS